MKAVFTLIIVALGLQVSAQEISGHVMDSKKEQLPSVPVIVSQRGIMKGRTVTDYDGNYTIKPLDPGYYDLMAVYPGYDSLIFTDVIVSPGQRTTVNLSMLLSKLNSKSIKAGYRKPLVDPDNRNIIFKTDPQILPDNQISDLVTLAPGIYQSQRGTPINSLPQRSSRITYVIDTIAIQEITADLESKKVYSDCCNPNDYVLSRKEIGQMPYTNINDAVATLPGIYQARLGDGLHIYGSR